MAFLPPVGDLSPTHVRTFTTLSTDIDLTAQVGCPAHAAQRIEAYNEDSGTQDVVLKGFDGTNFTIECQPDSVRVVDAAVTHIIASGTQTITSVVAYWWSSGSSRINQA